jgi:2-oxoisovalerate dehydrogenase E1 component
VKSRFIAFLAEQHPFVVPSLRETIDKAFKDRSVNSDLSAFGQALSEQISRSLKFDSAQKIECTPFVFVKTRFEQEKTLLLDGIEGFFAREQVIASISKDEKLWMLRGMILTRAVDLTLKKIFLSSEIKYKDTVFQGKGFRSLGQEAIYAAALRLNRGEKFSKKGSYEGDIVAPVIRDLGVVLAFTDDDIEAALNAQAGKEGPPTNGKDLHIGDFAKGVWPPAAPLAIATCSAVGIAAAFSLRKEKRVAVSFIGEGGTSLGEWHEAVNLAASRKLPVIFCVENNQTALSTGVHQQSAVRVFGDKAKGYGIPHVTLDGTDPEAVAAGFAWGAEHAREGRGPCLIELISMRMCGHAHHDDMLYLGHEPAPSFDYPTPTKTGYVDADKYALWAQKDPIKTYARRLISAKICAQKQLNDWEQEAKHKCEQALERVKLKDWPKPEQKVELFTWPRAVLSPPLEKGAGGIFSTLQPEKNPPNPLFLRGDKTLIESAPPFQKTGSTYMEAIAQAVYEQMQGNKLVYMLGEDIEPPYGNAFMMFRNAPKKVWPRFINTPIAENAIVGALVGMAAEGIRPIGEMQFNDFSASAFDQIVNNAAKLRFRTGISAPFVLRMPWGGLRRAGPYHSQDTIPWFHRAFGLKIVAPSTPHDARALFHAAMGENDPVLFYEHIALYREPSIRQILSEEIPKLKLGKAALRRSGPDLTLVSYGAFVHRALATAKRLADEHGVQCDVIDLRSLVPVDFELLGASISKTGRVLLIGEDSRTGSYLESLASKIAEGLFEHLDAPMKVIGSLDTPVPYSPSLEDAYLPSNELLLNAALELAHY